MNNTESTKREYPELDLIDQETKEMIEIAKKLKDIRDFLPEEEYNKIFNTIHKNVHKKYKQLAKEQRKNRK